MLTGKQGIGQEKSPGMCLQEYDLNNTNKYLNVEIKREVGFKQQEKCHQTDTGKDLFSSMLVLIKTDDLIRMCSITKI